MIRTTYGATTKMETADTQDQQLADDSVSSDLRLNLISQVREAFTLVNEITEGNRQIINKLDHFQNDSFSKPDLPNKSKEIAECKFQANNVVQYPMENAKRSDCAKAIETADTLSMKLDAFCKMFEEQMCLVRLPTQSNSVKVDPLSVVFRSGLRRKHIYGGDDNSVVLFLSGDFHTDGKSPIAIHAPNVRKGIHISRSMNLEAEKFKQYPGSPTPTTTTTLTAATTKETQSANASTIQMMATAMTPKATAGQATTAITTEGKTDRATSQACPSADNITGQLRRNQTKIKDDNRLVSYEAQIERQAYKPLAKNKNGGGFNADGRQNRLNGFKGARYQSVQDERRVPMSKNMIPKKNRSSEQGSQNSGSYRLGSDQTLNAKEQLNSRDMLPSSESMKIRKNARETVSAENVRIEDSKSQASVPKQWKGQMDTQDRVCPSEILNKREGTEGKMSKPLKKQTDVNITESALESTKKYNRHKGADKKMYGEDSMSALEISRTQGNSTATLSAVEPSHNRNGDKSVRHTSELLKKQNVTKNTLFTSKTSIKQGNTSDIMSASELHKKHNDISQTESTSKLLKKYSDSKGTVPTTGLTKNTLLAEETAIAMELSRTRVSTGDEISSSQRSKEDRAGNSKSNSSVKTSGIITDSTQGKSSKETYNHSTRGVHQGTVKNPTQDAPQVEEDTAQGLDLMPIVRQCWDMFSDDSSICSQLDAAGMKMELFNPDVSDPNKPLQFKYKLEELGFEQTVDVKMSDMLAMQAQVGSQPFQFPSLVGLDYWPKICEEEVEKGKRYRIDDDSIDTVLCIDISSSMKGEAWGQAMDFARNFVRGIKANPPINVGVQEKIALITFGHITKIHKHLTTDYDGILQLIDHLYPDGPSPMLPGFLLCLAAIEACGKMLQMRELTVFPRIIMITDGIPTSAVMLKGPDITFVESLVMLYECMSMYTDTLDQKAVELQISESRMNVDFKLFCVPVGDNRLDFLKTISKCTGGKVIHARGWKNLVRWSRNLSVASRYINRFKQSESTFSFECMQKENAHLSSKELREIRKLLEESKMLSIAADNNNGQVDIPIGTRVRRGPDWNRGDEDGGGPGTVIGKPLVIGQLQILWDVSASRRNVHIYRYGQDIMEIIPVNEPRILSPGENMAVGCYVERGRDWQHGNQDGGPGNIGIVIYFDTQMEIIHVIWPNGEVFLYKFGDNGRFEIRVSSVSAQPRNIYEIPAEGISGVDAHEVDQRNQQNKSALALPSDRTSKQLLTKKKRGNKNQGF